MYHSKEAADSAEEKFLLVYSKGDIPEDIPVVAVEEKEVWLPQIPSRTKNGASNQ